MRANLRPTDGPDAGRPLRLEPWQRGLLDAIDRERCPIVAIRAASQVGKTALSLGVGLRAAVDGAGTLLASATGESIKDLRRRLDRSLDTSPAISAEFVTAHRRGPGAATWSDRKTRRGGWVQLAAAGSPAQLARRTAPRRRRRRDRPLAAPRPERRGTPARLAPHAPRRLGRRRPPARHQFADRRARRDQSAMARRRPAPARIPVSHVRRALPVRVGAGVGPRAGRSPEHRLQRVRRRARRGGPAPDAPVGPMDRAARRAERRGRDLVRALAARLPPGDARPGRSRMATRPPGAPSGAIPPR